MAPARSMQVGERSCLRLEFGKNPQRARGATHAHGSCTNTALQDNRMIFFFKTTTLTLAQHHVWHRQILVFKAMCICTPGEKAAAQEKSTVPTCKKQSDISNHRIIWFGREPWKSYGPTCSSQAGPAQSVTLSQQGQFTPHGQNPSMFS